jgi:elongation factor Ts
MADITAALVKQLRDATNVSMMDCKRALVEAEGDLDKATKLLRERGMAVAAKRAEKVANQGRIAAAANDDETIMALAEVNCETDFVARNADFQSFVTSVTAKALETDSPLGEELQDRLMEKIAAIGENLKIRRNTRFQLQGTGRLASYIHLGGKVGVLVEVACTKPETVDAPAFQELAKDLTLHIAAAAPQYLTSSDVPADVLQSEREIYAKQVEGKPANIVEKIVDGKVNKFYTDVCLVAQNFVKEPKTTITQLLEQTGKGLGDTLSIRRFVRYQLGQ